MNGYILITYGTELDKTTNILSWNKIRAISSVGVSVYLQIHKTTTKRDQSRIPPLLDELFGGLLFMHRVLADAGMSLFVHVFHLKKQQNDNYYILITFQ